MESLTRLVSESLARHGVETALDPGRLQWSDWFHCESSSSTWPVPAKPGLFALAEEVIALGEVSGMGGKRMLALFQISEADDLGMALGRLFLPGTRADERLAGGRCFARYAMIDEAVQRRTAHAALQQWLASSLETAEPIASGF
jgi:hypothetical protein